MFPEAWGQLLRTIKCFVISPNSKIEQTKRLAAMTAKTDVFLTLAGTQICCSFKVHNLIT